MYAFKSPLSLFIALALSLYYYKFGDTGYSLLSCRHQGMREVQKYGNFFGLLWLADV
jgi:hypothetical protein